MGIPGVVVGGPVGIPHGGLHGHSIWGFHGDSLSNFHGVFQSGTGVVWSYFQLPFPY